MQHIMYRNNVLTQTVPYLPSQSPREHHNASPLREHLHKTHLGRWQRMMQAALAAGLVWKRSFSQAPAPGCSEAHLTPGM